jgi:hypothetical protein
MPRVGPDGGPHGIEVMAVIARGDGNRLAPAASVASG